METILGAAGLKPEETMLERDLADLYLPPTTSSLPDLTSTSDNTSATTTSSDVITIRDQTPWRTEFYYEFPPINGRIPQSSALVRKDWKYIFWKDYAYEQLFNILDDPLEMNDLRNHTEFTDLLNEMRSTHFLLQRRAIVLGIPGTRCDPLWPAGANNN